MGIVLSTPRSLCMSEEVAKVKLAIFTFFNVLFRVAEYSGLDCKQPKHLEKQQNPSF